MFKGQFDFSNFTFILWGGGNQFPLKSRLGDKGEIALSFLT